MKHIIFCLFAIFLSQYAIAQSGAETFGLPGSEGYNEGLTGENGERPEEEEEEEEKEPIPSIMSAWTIGNDGASFNHADLDTALTFYHVYNPMWKQDIRPVYTGNIGGAYLYTDFFKREYENDFFFSRSVEGYMQLPNTVQYYNTTTPYSVLTYAQGFNKNVKPETLFNIEHSQNVNEDFNFRFFYKTNNSEGGYQNQEVRRNEVGLLTTYRGERFNSHVAMLYNRNRSEENGGLEEGQIGLNGYDDSETYIVNLSGADSQVKNFTFSTVNEYMVGKNEEVEDEQGYLVDRFRPILGFMYKLEYASNSRLFNESSPDFDYFENTYIDSTVTADEAKYNRLTNIFQLKFHENPDSKFTFSKRVYIGSDIITASTLEPDTALLDKDKIQNTYVGGGIAREEGKFWTWDFSGRLYFTGYRSGQTELSGFMEKPLRIKKDTTTLHLGAELNSIVPDYFQDKYNSNHYSWSNNFDNTNEVKIKAHIESQRFRTKIGFNYALYDNYIYNNAEALPEQLSNELMVMSMYLNKDFVSKNWFVRARVMWQESNNNAVHLPTFTGLFSVNWKFILAGVLHNRLGFDVRYTSAFYADTYNPATGQYYWQDQQKIGNYPITNVHYNFKLKRARIFFQVMNLTSGMLDGEYWAAPDYPMYRRTFRFGVAWSFYD